MEQQAVASAAPSVQASTTAMAESRPVLSTLAVPKQPAASGPAEEEPAIKRQRVETLAVGTVVEVENRQGPGWKGGNGGSGKIRKVVVAEDGSVTYNVKYFMNGSEKGVLPEHVKLPHALEERERKEVVNFEPVDFVAEAEARAAARAEVKRRREAKKRREEEEQRRLQREQRKKAKGAKKAAGTKKKKKGASGGAASTSAASSSAAFHEDDHDEEAFDEEEPAPQAPQRPPPPEGHDAVQQTVVRMSRETREDEFEIQNFMNELSKQAGGTSLSRVQVEAALAYMEEDNRVMYTGGVIFLI